MSARFVTNSSSQAFLETQEDNEISIKLFLHRSNGHVAKHRIRGTFDWIDISNFVAQVWTGGHFGNPIVIEYDDDEGDTIRVSSEVEWKECVRVYRDVLSRNGRPLQLNVFRQGQDDADEWSGTEDIVAGSQYRRVEPNTAADSELPAHRAPPSRIMDDIVLKMLAAEANRAPPPSAHVNTVLPEPEEEEQELEQEQEITEETESGFVRVDLPTDTTVQEEAPVAEPPAAPVAEPEPVPVVAPLSPRSEAATKLRSVFPDMTLEEAHRLLYLYGNVQMAVSMKLGA